MRVLVTGAFGNIGLNVVNALLDQGHTVRCFDVKTTKAEVLAKQYCSLTEVRWGDIRDASSISDALDGIDAVIHMAAIIPPVSEKNIELAYAVNVTGTDNLISVMNDHPSCKRLVLASSSAVHGSDPNRSVALNAKTPYNPMDNYAEHKVQNEQAVQSSGLLWSILRIAAVPPLNPSNAQKGSLKVLYEVPVDSRIELLHEKDAATAFANAISCDEAVNKILFLGGGEKNRCRVTGYEMVSMLLNASGVGALPKSCFSQVHGLVHADWVDTEESQRLLNYQKHTVEDMAAEIKRNVGLTYYVAKLFSPVARFFLIKKSPYS